MRRLSTNLLSLSFLLTGCATLPATIDRTAAVPELRTAIWGIEVQDDSGRVLYERNAHTLLMPASNRKLFAAATAVDCLGFDHRSTTELWRDGRDVILRGGGDPALGGRYAFDRDAVFAPFVAALRARGITVIEGDLIADVSLFDRIQSVDSVGLAEAQVLCSSLTGRLDFLELSAPCRPRSDPPRLAVRPS